MWDKSSREQDKQAKKAKPDHGKMAGVGCEKLCLLLLTCTPFSKIEWPQVQELSG